MLVCVEVGCVTVLAIAANSSYSVFADIAYRHFAEMYLKTAFQSAAQIAPAQTSETIWVSRTIFCRNRGISALLQLRIALQNKSRQLFADG